jgi:hypothetical protein
MGVGWIGLRMRGRGSLFYFTTLSNFTNERGSGGRIMHLPAKSVGNRPLGTLAVHSVIHRRL